jgi:organic radical activating enzyme
MTTNPEYSIWLHWLLTHECNFRCFYCANARSKYQILPTKKIPIQQVLHTLNNLQKKIHLTLSGGEPFLVPNLTDVIIQLTQAGHFVSINTNLTSPQIKKFIHTIPKQIAPEKIIYILASFHFRELSKKKLIPDYFQTLKEIKQKGVIISVKEVAHPKLIDSVKTIKHIFQEQNVDMTFAPFNGFYQGKTYPKSYTNEELEIFQISRSETLYHDSNGLKCNAGSNVAVVHPNGDVCPCFQVTDKKLGNIYSIIQFNPEYLSCPVKQCKCPLFILSDFLYQP